MNYKVIEDEIIDNSKFGGNEQILINDINLIKNTKSKRYSDDEGFSNRVITISYLYMNAPLNFFNELSMSKR